MSRRSRSQASAETRRRAPDGDPLGEAINAYLRRRQAEQMPAPKRGGRLPRRKRGGGWPTPAITALAILTVASFVLLQIVRGRRMRPPPRRGPAALADGEPLKTRRLRA